jgi:hypothetical protein
MNLLETAKALFNFPAYMDVCRDFMQKTWGSEAKYIYREWTRHKVSYTTVIVPIAEHLHNLSP